MLRWGLLGAAHITGKSVAPALQAVGQDLAVVGARSLDRAAAFAERHGVRRAVGSYDDVLADPEIDAVYVALPNDLHESWTVAALDAGKHVLCEKPLALDAAGARRMAEAASRSDRLLMEAVMSRFHPRMQAALELVGEGGAGDVRAVSASFTFRMQRERNYREVVDHGGGALLDVGVYGVSAVRWMLGEEPADVAAFRHAWPSGVDGTTSALLWFPSTATAAVTASFEAAMLQSVEVVGTTATLRLPDAFNPGLHPAPLLRDGEEIGRWSGDAYQAMVAAFAEAVAGGAPHAPLPASSSVATAVVLDRIAAAARPTS